MVLLETMDSSLQVSSGEPEVKEFKYLKVLFTSQSKMECEADWRIGASSAVLQTLYRTVMKRVLS